MTGDLPENWVALKLGDVVAYGKTEKAEPDQIPGDAWILELEDVERDTSRVLQRQTFAERRSKSTKNRFEKGDVLYGKLRPYLNKVVLADAPGYCTTEIVPLRGNDAIDGRFLFHWFKGPAFLDYVAGVSHGINMPRLGTEAGNAAPLLLAPLAEQKRIADKLDTLLARVDACRDRLDRVDDILKRFRQSVLITATSNLLTADWRGNTGLPLETWSVATVEQVASVGTGSTPLRSNPGFYSVNGTPWVTSSATSQPLITEADECVTEVAIKAHRLKTYPVGTLLVAMYGEGKTRGQVTELGITATINQACAAVVVDESKALKKFVKLVLQASYLAMRDQATGGNQPNLNLSKIKSFQIPLPRLEEQAEIVRRVERLLAWADRVESRLATSRQQAERLTPAVLAKAFRGELVPQDPNDEPVAALLERIRSGSTTATTPASGKPARGRSRQRTA